MAKKAMTTNGAMMKKVMKTATLPTIDSPLLTEDNTEAATRG